MSRKMFLVLLAFIAGSILHAQNRPLKGSGNIVKIAPDIKDFTSLEFLDMDGTIQVEVGKPFSIDIQIDDNLIGLLETVVKNGELSVKLKGNLNNKLYIENTNIKVILYLPELLTVKHRGNDYLTISGLSGNSFLLKNFGNGNVKLDGKVDDLDIRKSGNGDVNAKELVAQNATIVSSGNGDVILNASISFKANGSGNGYIKQVGKGTLSDGSSKSGNGKIVIPDDLSINDLQNAERINVFIQNNSTERVQLLVQYPYKGSYGLPVNINTTVKENFPIGTKLYKSHTSKNQDQPLFIISANDKEQTLIIN